MRTRKHQYSFAGGEVGPELYGRGDAAKFQTGVAQARNFVVKPQGSARSRPGGQFVAYCRDQGNPSQLIPFLYDLNNSLMIEFGAATFKFHQQGGTNVWAQPIEVGELSDVEAIDNSIANGVMRTLGPHGLSTGDEVRVTLTNGGTFPTNLDAVTLFRVTVLDARRVRFSTVGGYPTLITIGNPTQGSGYARIFKTSTLPRTYVPNKQFLPGAVGATTIAVTAPHNFQIGDLARVLTTGTRPLVGGVAMGAGDHYVVSTTTTSVGLSTTPGGAPLAFSAGGVGVHTLVRRYLAGEFVFIDVAGGAFSVGRVLYCRDDVNSEAVTVTVGGGWYEQPGDGSVLVPHPYLATDLFAVNYDQSADVLTLVHPNHPERTLTRYPNNRWVLRDITFAPTTAAPTVAVAVNYGELVKSIVVSAPVGAQGAAFGTLAQGVNIGDALLCTVGPYPQLSVGSVYIVNQVSGTYPSITFQLRDLTGELVIGAGSGGPQTNTFAFTDLINDDNTYKVSSVNDEGVESLSAETTSIKNNLSNTGASNTLSWSAVTNAVKFNIYKKLSGSGLFGKIGETEALTFKDSDITPDLSETAPKVDVKLGSATNYSRATAHFEQRKCLGGSNENPRTLFLSRSGTENDYSSRIPVLDDDRIALEIAAREAHVIMHIVPLNDLVLLSQLGEWRMFSVNSDAITPTTVAVRPQSFIGASTVRPQVVNNSLIFCAARGGHVMEMGFQAQSRGYVTGDLSLRAAHLFDDLTIFGSAYQKAPVPVVWFVSSNGTLLGMTYVPEQQIAAWHQHNTPGGAYESVGVSPDDEEDRVYVTVARTDSAGVVRRHIERIDKLVGAGVEGALGSSCLDKSFYAGNNATGTIDVRGGRRRGDAIQVFSSTVIFSKFDVGSRIYLNDDVTVEITEFLSGNSLGGVAITDIPADLHYTPLTVWAFGRKEFRFPSSAVSGELTAVHRPTTEGGVTIETVTVVDDVILLSTWARQVSVGTPYNCDLRLLPLTAQMEAMGYGRGKALNHAWMRVFSSAGLQVGPDEGSLTDVQSLKDTGGLVSEQTRSIVSEKWSPDAQLLIRQHLPLPATIVAVTLEVSIAE